MNPIDRILQILDAMNERADIQAKQIQLLTQLIEINERRVDVMEAEHVRESNRPNEHTH